MTAISEIVRYSTNGVIDTQRPVWENIERLANAAHSWVTYDITTGLWSVVINRDEASAGSFSDNNIIGGITVSSSPTASVYNVVEIQHPDRDIEDGSSFVRAALPAGDLRPGEDENILSLTYPIINDQIQALNLGLTELKQSRLDLIIQFVTDYSMNYIRAGDIIDITNTAYGFAGKLFRVLTVEETDADDGGVVFSITAQEHSSDIYEHDLSRITLSNEDGVFSIGDIGAMSTPQITINGESQTPHMLIESVFPSISAPINGVEIWKYEITDPDELADWDDPLLYPDVNRKYTLSNVFFAEDTYELNSDIEFRLDTVDPGNYLLKLRPFNDTTKGPFTSYGSTITYVVDIAADLNPTTLADAVTDELDLIPVLDQAILFHYSYSGFWLSDGNGFSTTNFDTTTETASIAGFNTVGLSLNAGFNFGTNNNAELTSSCLTGVTIQLRHNGTPLEDISGISNTFTNYTNFAGGTIHFNIVFENDNLIINQNDRLDLYVEFFSNGVAPSDFMFYNFELTSFGTERF